MEADVDGGGAGVDALIQGAEDSTPRAQIESVPANEIEAAVIVLLCVAGCVNGLEVIFLVDSGASDVSSVLHLLKK